MIPGMGDGVAMWTAFHTEYGTESGPGQEREDAFPRVVAISRGWLVGHLRGECGWEGVPGGLWGKLERWSGRGLLRCRLGRLRSGRGEEMRRRGEIAEAFGCPLHRGPYTAAAGLGNS